jgi:hypothetical protein
MPDREKTVSGAAPSNSAFIADILSQPERLAALDADAVAGAARPLVGDLGRYFTTRHTPPTPSPFLSPVLMSFVYV